MAKIEVEVTKKYTLKLTQEEFDAIVGALETVSDNDVPGSYELWKAIRQA